MSLLSFLLCITTLFKSASLEEFMINYMEHDSRLTIQSGELTYQPVNLTNCFYADRADCSTLDSCVQIGRAIICCDVDSMKIEEFLIPKLTSSDANAQMIHIFNATLDELDITQYTMKGLTSISFTDGKINRIKGQFKNDAIKCLNLSNNGINNVMDKSILENLAYLKELDLSGNNLKELPNFSKMQHNITVNIKDNIEMLCRNIFEAIEQNKMLNLMNPNTTFCQSSQDFRWFNSTETIAIAEAIKLKLYDGECSEEKIGVANCKCSIYGLDIVEGKSRSFNYKVDCSNQNLTTLPLKLPPNTVFLNVSHNSIKSLERMSNPSYDYLRYFYAENNSIIGIRDLEGTKFLDNFYKLSLKKNKIKLLSTYILSNAFDKLSRYQEVSLGDNFLHCDCNSGTTLKEWLFERKTNIPDYDEVYCENNELVINLKLDELCGKPKNWKEYINFMIIIIEIVLLAMIGVKLRYDYRIYKTTGYLPWPASKIPKLPCDCLCE